MKPDGTGVAKLTNSMAPRGRRAAYSPDGRLIAFEADRGDYPAKDGVYVMNANDGSEFGASQAFRQPPHWTGRRGFRPTAGGSSSLAIARLHEAQRRSR